jgi:hypothetical protein
MFNKPTDLIIGAGASAEFSMPVGSALTTRVASSVTLGSGRTPNNEVLRQQMRECLGSDRANKLFRLGAILAAVVTQFVSMDEALHFLSDEADIVELGKLAIAHEIMNAEHLSNLYKALQANDPSVGDTNNTWAYGFLRLALSASRRAELSELFANVTVIDFNYDRILPQYLYWALQRNLEIPKEMAAECVRKLKILHPYGSLGQLEWQSASGFLSFGAIEGNLAEISKRIRTYTEEARGAEYSQISAAIDDAKVVIVIGVGFHRQNIRLASTSDSLMPRPGMRAFVTAHGIDHRNHDAIRREMANALACDPAPEIFEGMGNHMFQHLGLSIGLAAA